MRSILRTPSVFFAQCWRCLWSELIWHGLRPSKIISPFRACPFVALQGVFLGGSAESHTPPPRPIPPPLNRPDSPGRFASGGIECLLRLMRPISFLGVAMFRLLRLSSIVVLRLWVGRQSCIVFLARSIYGLVSICYVLYGGTTPSPRILATCRHSSSILVYTWLPSSPRGSPGAWHIGFRCLGYGRGRRSS